MRICQGDCLDVMAQMDENSVDTIITDPPYGLEFMGKDWDRGIPGVRFWREALRVAKPGAMMLAFGGTRTWHRLACAIEDAGWELRDTMMWLYGSGFPKSHDISKAIDKAAGAEREVVGRNPNTERGSAGHKTQYVGGVVPDREAYLTVPATNLAAEWDGWGTALKPAWEPIIIAMAPRDGTYAENAEKWGVAGLWIDGGRVPLPRGSWVAERGKTWLRSGEQRYDAEWQGPERPLGTCADRVTDAGRWPANLILDEAAGELLDQQSGESNGGHHSGSPPGFQTGPRKRDLARDRYVTDSGGASRFFYCAKASRAERNAGLDDSDNRHPTVKPLALLRYLCRLTKTPTGGIVLDPFMGSGSTGCAAVQEGRDFIGIELDAEYCEIARRRIEHWARQPVLEMV